MRRLFDGLVDRAGNMPPLPGIYPDYSAPIIRNGPEGRELVMARWGMPTRRSTSPADKSTEASPTSGRRRHRTGGRGSDASTVVSCHSPASPRMRPWPTAAVHRLVCLRREPSAGLFRRYLGDLDLGSESQGRAGAHRPVRVSDLCAERRDWRGPSQGDAGDPDRITGVGDLAHSTLGGGEGAATSTAGRFAPHRRAGRKRGCTAGLAAGECMKGGADRTAPRTASIA
jgi:hypothetical protein